MNPLRLTPLLLAGFLASGQATPPAEDPLPLAIEIPTSDTDKLKALQTHREGSEKAAIDQDKQAANASELIDEQTSPKVIEFLEMVESLMGEATDRLEEGDTGGDTIAIQIEITESIHEAAKAKEKAGEGKPGQPGMGAMMEMMEQMMGKGKQAKGNGGDTPAEQGGTENREADSDSGNEAVDGASNKNQSERRVPRAAGKSGSGLPPEFQKALEGYNKNLPKK